MNTVTEKEIDRHYKRFMELIKLNKDKIKKDLRYILENSNLEMYQPAKLAMLILAEGFEPITTQTKKEFSAFLRRNLK